MVFADDVRSLVQEVVSGVGDLAVNPLDEGFGTLPVAAEFDLTAHFALCLGQAILVPLEARQRLNHGLFLSVPEGRKADDAKVNASRCRGWVAGLCHLSFCLDRDVPMAGLQANGDVFHQAQNLSTSSVAQPPELWQEDPLADLVELDLLAIWEAETVMLAALLESRERCPILEEVFVGAVEVLESVLKGMHWRFFKPRSFFSVAPGSQQFGHRHILNVLAASIEIFLLKRQCLIEHETSHASELLQLTPLLTSWLDPELVGLDSLHEVEYNLVYG